MQEGKKLVPVLFSQQATLVMLLLEVDHQHAFYLHMATLFCVLQFLLSRGGSTGRHGLAAATPQRHMHSSPLISQSQLPALLMDAVQAGRSSVVAPVALDVLAEPDLTPAYEDRGAALAVEQHAHERFALEDDAAVHWLRPTSGLLHENTDNAVAPGPACIIR